MKVMLLNDIRGYSGAEVIFNTIAEELEGRGHEAMRATREDIPHLWSMMEGFRPDVLHQHNATQIGGASLAFMRRYPAVQTFHDYWPICRCRDHFLVEEGRACPEVDRNGERCRRCPNYLGMLRSPSFLRTAWGEDPTVVFTGVSEYVARKVREYGYKDVRAAHNGIRPEPNLYDTTDANFIFVPAKSDHRDVKKGLPVMDQIAGELKQFRFVHAGGGRWRNMEELGLLPREQLMEYYRSCSLAVIPSVWEEPNGLPCQEAMQFGKVILGFSFAGGVPEYVKNYTVGTPLEMEGLIVRLMSDPALRRQAGEENRARFLEKFTLEKMVDRYLVLYEAAIEKFNQKRKAMRGGVTA